MRTFETVWRKTGFRAVRAGKILELHFGVGTLKLCPGAMISEAQAAAARLARHERLARNPGERPRGKDGKLRAWDAPDA